MQTSQISKSVYIACAGPNRHKIGISLAPKRRVADLSGASGYPLQIIDQFEVEDALAVERVGHWLLRERRIHGEWFEIDAASAGEAVRSAIELVASGFRAPRMKSANTTIAGSAKPPRPRGASTLRMHNRLSVRSVQQITKPGVHADGGGLYLRVDASGAKRWVFVFFWNGRRREMGLGPVRTVTLFEARNGALEARRSIRNGVDPIEERRVKSGLAPVSPQLGGNQA